MMSANAALAPNSKLSSIIISSIPSRCTPLRRPMFAVPAALRQQLPTTTLHLQAATKTPVLTADHAAGFTSTDDRFHVMDFHHVELWCADAATAAGRFSFALGLPLAARSDLATGNAAHASRLLRSRSGPLAFLFTAPYAGAAASPVLPSFSAAASRRFAADYGGLAVRAVAVRVADAAEAFRASVAAGARPAFAPAALGHGGFVLAEVELYGDVVLRFVSYPDDADDDGVAFLPGFESSPDDSCPPLADYGLTRFDHVAGGVPDLDAAAAYIAGFTGFHEFHRVDGDEVGTDESSINGVVLADGAERVLLTLLEPVPGTKRQSQMQTFLDHHGGAGVQHLAMVSDDLIATLREIRARSAMGGFELLPPPPPGYYDGVRRLVADAGDVLSEAQIRECQELGVRVGSTDDGGVVLQTITKAAGDRPTLLLEFMQRIGCVEIDESGKEYRRRCSGFAKGNVIHLVKSIEDYDKTLDAPTRVFS